MSQGETEGKTMITDEHIQEVQSSLRDIALPPIIWPKLEIVLGLMAAFVGLAFGIAAVMREHDLMILVGAVLFVLGLYLALAGHRSHLYIFQVRATAFLLQELRKQKTS